MELMDRRANWAALDLQVARETQEVGAPTDTLEKPGAQASKETKVPRGTLAAQDAGDHQEILEIREARDTKATTELLEVPE